MIQGTLKRPLTLETLLSYTTEYDIFRHYLGHDFKLGVPFRCPFFHDGNPSASIIRTRNGRLHFTVFGKDEYNGKVIDFVRRFYPSYNYDQILKSIDRDLNLGIVRGDELPSTKSLWLPNVEQIEERPKEAKLIQVVSRPFIERDLRFWWQWHLSKDDLLKPPVVYPIREVQIDKVPIPLAPNELAYGYYFGDGLWKIYRPFAPSKAYKWRCNTPKDFLFGIDNLDPKKGALQIKAVKDYKVVSKHYSNCYIITSEGTGFINEKNLSFLLTLPWVVVNNDPDDAGVKSTNYCLGLSDKFQPFHVPSSLISLPRVKDLSDIDRYHGSNTVGEIIIKNIERL